jgi:hypothetical protein
MAIPTWLIYDSVQRTPSDVAAQQIIFDGAGVLIMGALVAWANKKPGLA